MSVIRPAFSNVPNISSLYHEVVLQPGQRVHHVGTGSTPASLSIHVPIRDTSKSGPGRTVIAAKSVAPRFRFAALNLLL